MDYQIAYEDISPYVRFVNDLKRRGLTDFGDREIYDHELIFCVDGNATMTLEGTDYAITRGDVFFLRPGLRNRMVVNEGEFFHAHCVHFDWVPMDESYNFTAEQVYMAPPETAEDLAFLEKLRRRPNADAPDLNFSPLIRGTDYDRLLPLFRGLYDSYRKFGNIVAANLRMRGLFLQILSELMYTRDARFATTERSHRVMVDKAIDYINVHYKEDLAITKLAEASGMSSKYFGVLFKRVTGRTVNEYVMQVRMTKAEELLLQTDASLDEIAKQVGVRDEFYVVKLFKRYKGITPGRYRRMFLATKNSDVE